MRAWGEQQHAKIKRIDLAHDDFSGQHISVAKALDWFHAGGFTVGGRPPAPRYIDDLGTGSGKTLYLGSRENGKMIRVYEKGRQLGDPLSPWVRAEVEIHSTDRVVPWDTAAKEARFSKLNSELDSLVPDLVSQGQQVMKVPLRVAYRRDFKNRSRFLKSHGGA